MKLTQSIPDPGGIVTKLIFETNDAIAETVVYRYGDRGVVCFSCQSGCPVGCTFCGTGNQFIRNLDVMEMLAQIDAGIEMLQDVPNVQLMSMSMGEPMLNCENVLEVVRFRYQRSFYLSTAGIKDPRAILGILEAAAKRPLFGLQLSLHATTDENRDKLFRNKTLPRMTIAELRVFADAFKLVSGRRAYFNYICKEDNTTDEDLNRLIPIIRGHHLTCSVLSSADRPRLADEKWAKKLIETVSREPDIETSLFNPVGQDTIGGGCGQLFCTQKRMKELQDRMLHGAGARPGGFFEERDEFNRGDVPAIDDCQGGERGQAGRRRFHPLIQ